MISGRNILIIFLLVSVRTMGQIGGETTYQFLELTNSARIAALGGNQVALMDSTGLDLPYHNPSLLNKSMVGNLQINYVNYLTDINYGYASYALKIPVPGNTAVGMQFINYGKFPEATETGVLTGNTFKAGEYALNLIYSNQYKQWNYGINLKPVLSIFESYQSFGIVADVGIHHLSKSGFSNMALVIRNIGTQITPYYENGEIESIPFDIQFGISKQLQHAPVIISVTAQHLNNWKLVTITEDEKETDDFFASEPQESIAKQFARHLVFGVELLPSKNFTIRAGYNYQRRQELKFEEKVSTVGLSFGFGIKTERFRFDFATSRFHLAGSSTVFSLAVNLDQLLKPVPVVAVSN